MEIKYSDKAVKQTHKLHKVGRKNAETILKAIESYAGNPAGKFDVKALKGGHGNIKRLRVGNYRVLFEIANNVMLVYEIKDRKEAYRD